MPSAIQIEILKQAVERIPCELTVLTFNGSGSAWLGCEQCSRCVLLKALSCVDPVDEIRKCILPKPINGGYKLRADLRKKL